MAFWLRIKPQTVRHSEDESRGAGRRLRYQLCHVHSPGVASPAGASQGALRSMSMSTSGAALRVQELRRRVPDPQLKRWNGYGVLFGIRETSFPIARGRLALSGARELYAAQGTVRAFLGRSGRSWAFWICTPRALHAPATRQSRPCRRAAPAIYRDLPRRRRAPEIAVDRAGDR